MNEHAVHDPTDEIGRVPDLELLGNVFAETFATLGYDVTAEDAARLLRRHGRRVAGRCGIDADDYMSRYLSENAVRALAQASARHLRDAGIGRLER